MTHLFLEGPHSPPHHRIDFSGYDQCPQPQKLVFLENEKHDECNSRRSFKGRSELVKEFLKCHRVDTNLAHLLARVAIGGSCVFEIVIIASASRLLLMRNFVVTKKKVCFERKKILIHMLKEKNNIF